MTSLQRLKIGDWQTSKSKMRVFGPAALVAFAAVAVAALASGVAAEDELLDTPLHIIVHDGPAEDLRRAVADGAEVNAPGAGGQTPLMAATLRGALEHVKVLLELGADVSIGEENGYTPIHGAGFQGRAEVMQALIDHGMDPDDLHEDGYRPIHRACWGGEQRHADTVEVLLKAGAKHNAETTDGSTPLDLAYGNNDAIVKILEEFEQGQAKQEL